MKKIVCLLLSLMLALGAGAALAAGLGGLSGGGFEGLFPGGTAQAMPDPAEVTEKVGSLYAADYAFSADYLCDAYIYEKPTNVSSFIEKYTRACRDAGYSVTEATIDGQNGYTIQNGDGLYAMLVPSFSGQMLLLVQKGMQFDMTERSNYGYFTYNDRDYETEYYFGEISRSAVLGDSYSMTFKMDRAPMKVMSFYIPLYARAGDEFYVTKENIIEGFSISMDHKTWLVNQIDTVMRKDCLDSARDYCRLTVESIKDVEYGVQVSGYFEGRFSSGEHVFENFYFNAIIEE